MKSKVLVATTIRQKSSILQCSFKGLENLNIEDFCVSYFFVDDNDSADSSDVLRLFAEKHDVVIKKGDEILNNIESVKYLCDDETHHWNKINIKKIAAYKDYIIEYAINTGYDYLFFVDSDIVLNAQTLNQLVSRNVDIVSCVFWTQWKKGEMLEPQCFWIRGDSFLQYYSDWEYNQMVIDTFAKLRVPGLYKVDGLGACTLISKQALNKGVRFKQIPNLSVIGEDRHFCIRAGALDIPLYMDTVYPAYHIYREEYISRVDEFLRDGFKFDMCQTAKEPEEEAPVCPQKRESTRKIVMRKAKNGLRKVYRYCFTKERKNNTQQELPKRRVTDNNKIVLQMIVRNETGRYLEKSISSLIDFIDYFVIMDDASTDGTVALCEQLLRDHPHTIIKNKESQFHEEYKLRNKLWNEVVKLNPGWIFSFDADEVLQDGAGNIIKYLINNKEIDAYRFKPYDMWNENEYREDKWWRAHLGYRGYLMRYQPDYDYHWKETNQHCGRFPLEFNKGKVANINVKIKHFGWAREEDRINKYERYMKLDPQGEYGIMEQYESILDTNPVLIKFDDSDICLK